MFIGGLELAEQSQLVQEVAGEPQDDQDLDEETLVQLASGLKSDVLSPHVPRCTVVSKAVTEPTFSLFS